MKENEALELGFSFTGACWNVWEEKEEKRYKEEAARIKKTFKGADYRIVSGRKNGWLGPSSKAIYGNDIYAKVQYFKEDTAKEWLDDYEHRLEAARLKYENELKKLEEDYQFRLNKYNEIMSLKK